MLATTLLIVASAAAPPAPGAGDALQAPPHALLGAAAALPHGGSFPPPPPPPPPGGDDPGSGGGAPPGGSDTGGGSAPTTGGGYPSNPGPAGPSTPGSAPASPGASPGPAGTGPGIPGSPGIGPTAPTTPGSAAGPVDRMHWSHWWNLERGGYLLLRERVRSRRTVPEGQSSDADLAGVAVSRKVIDELVLPTLLELLETSRYDDVLTSALIAVGRIGAGEDVATTSRILVAAKSQLRHASQEVSETAALTLGILEDARAIQPLVEIATGSEAGARLVDRTTVPSRTRAFACFALGLAARELEDVEVRQRIALALIDVMLEPHARDDAPIAATMALGLCPLPVRSTVPASMIRRADHVQLVLSRSGSIGLLSDIVEGRGPTGVTVTARWRSHAAVALARLAKDARPETHDAVMTMLGELGQDSTTPSEVRTGIAVALGEIATATDSGTDLAGRKHLSRAVRKGQGIERRLAVMALAQAGSAPGAGDAPLAGSNDVRRELLNLLARGKSSELPWAGLALGVHAYRTGETADDATVRSLLDRTRRGRNADQIGAYAIGCALACEHAKPALSKHVGEQLTECFRKVNDPIAKGHIAVALGLIGHTPAREDLWPVFERAKFQPQLLWSVSVALGLMEDPRVTPKLVESLANARALSSRSAAASALGHVGDRRALPALVEMATDMSRPAGTRAFACVALGVLCDESELPWRLAYSHALPYGSLTATLSGNTKGLLDIL